MKRLTTGIAIMLIVVYGMLSVGTAHAKKDRKAKKEKISTYEVTITNITKSQIISPPIVISHNKNFQLFILGDRASEGLAALAEDADTTQLEKDLEESGSVYDVSKAVDVIKPGMWATVEVKTKHGYEHISAAGMLVTTNDAFFAVRGVKVRKKDGPTVYARAYDAGSEANNELCDYIPGPPCDSHFVRDTNDAEGYVYIHSGIHGSANLDPADFDWQNPVAIITVQKLK